VPIDPLPYGDRIVYAEQPYGALEGADGLAAVTEWPEFRPPDFEAMCRLLTGRVVFDGRNLYDPKAMRGHGFTHYGIGRAGDAAGAGDHPAAPSPRGDGAGS
jgi:UDPglucose 6-dehydrogenase